LFISITFPIADFRSLHVDNAGRLERPRWGSADPRAAFAKGFGAIHMRTKSGNGFVGENYYADCNALVRYPSQLFLKPLSNHDRPVLAYPFYRRFYFDGQFAGRFELGFRLNEASINEISESTNFAEYDVAAISKQILSREVSLHLLDGRIEKCSFYRAMIPLRDGYIMSSSRGASLNTYDIDSVGSSYVSVGAPFVFIRSSPTTKIARVKQKRHLIDNENTSLFVTRSGVHNQNFDTIVLPSARELDSESPEERLARLFYSQIRALTFAHSFYLRQIDDRKIAGSNRLEPAIQSLIDRIKGLSPIENSAGDQETCNDLKNLLENSDINVTALAKEIESRLRPRGIRKLMSRVLGYFDEKANIAIEAAASTATKQMLGDGR
jgi:hypothetical protein